MYSIKDIPFQWKTPYPHWLVSGYQIIIGRRMKLNITSSQLLTMFRNAAQCNFWNDSIRISLGIQNPSGIHEGPGLCDSLGGKMAHGSFPKEVYSIM